MSLRAGKLVVWLSLLMAAAAALCLSLELAAQDTLQLYVRTVVSDYYHLDYDTGSGFSSRESMTNTIFPSESRHGVAQVNFAVPPRMQRMRLQLGERPATISIVRLCLNRALMVSSCIDGAEAASYVEASHDASIARKQGEADFIATGPTPFLVLDHVLIGLLQSRNAALLLGVRVALFLAAALFLFCAFVSLLRPVTSLWTDDAALVFVIAAALRAVMFYFYKPGIVSDSDWFLRYLQFHIYGQPGSRGIVYPMFTTVFDEHRDALFAAQFLLGAIGAVFALLLLRSFKQASRLDFLWALLAACLPVLIGMEAIILSESFSLFLILAALLALVGLTENPRSRIAAAGLGGWCALLYHTKPQFGFVIVLCAVALAYRERTTALRRVAMFLVPVAALQVLALALNFTCGNFLGTSSMLGYSLFNHAQQQLTCPPANSDPHIKFYCDARAELGTGASTTSYTAWVIFPAMHQLHEPFYRVLEDYQRLSLQIIGAHPAAYARTVSQSFFDFWTREVPMTRFVYLAGDRNHLALRRFMPGVLSTEHWARGAFHLAYFVLLFMVIAKRSWPRQGFVFWAVMTGIVVGSSLVQAAAESSPENSRYAVPTEPLVVIGIVYSVVLLKSKTPVPA